MKRTDTQSRRLSIQRKRDAWIAIRLRAQRVWFDLWRRRLIRGDWVPHRWHRPSCDLIRRAAAWVRWENRSMLPSRFTWAGWGRDIGAEQLFGGERLSTGERQLIQEALNEMRRAAQEDSKP